MSKSIEVNDLNVYYGNFLAVRTENKDDENIKKLNDLLHTPEVKKFIEEKWSDGSVLPSF